MSCLLERSDFLPLFSTCAALGHSLYPKHPKELLIQISSCTWEVHMYSVFLPYQTKRFTIGLIQRIYTYTLPHQQWQSFHARRCPAHEKATLASVLVWHLDRRIEHGMNPSYCSLIQVLFITFHLVFLIKIPELKLINPGRIKCQHSEQIASMLNKEAKGNFHGISAIVLYFERGNIPGAKHLFLLDGILDSLVNHIM